MSLLSSPSWWLEHRHEAWSRTATLDHEVNLGTETMHRGVMKQHEVF